MVLNLVSKNPKSKILETQNNKMDSLKYHQRQLFPECYYSTAGISTFWNSNISKYGHMFGPKIKPIFSVFQEVPTKKRLERQAKSLGQYEFKAMAFNSDLSQVHERLAVLEQHNIELETVHSPPALPPRDYYFEDVV